MKCCEKGKKNMGKNVKEASVVMAKCRKSKMPFGIRIEKRMDNVWYCNWAFKLSEKLCIIFICFHRWYLELCLNNRVL